MIKGSDLENRVESFEHDLRAGRKVKVADVEAAHDQAMDDVRRGIEELKRRIDAARRVTPTGKELHCRDCFTRGRDAALRVIDGAEP